MVTTDWNAPVNGDWTTVDATRAPWANGIMTIAHEDVLLVKRETERIASEYVQVNPWDDPYATGAYIQSTYNNFTKWEKAINGDTFNVIKTYDPEIHTLGINENGIILPEVTPDTTSEGTTSDNTETGEV
jgi:hypothetical protein